MQLPVIVAPMFLISNPKMVIESARAGIIGTFPLLNARPISVCEEWLTEIKEALPTEKWGVNIICHKGENPRYDEDVELIKKYQPPLVITSLGNPTPIVEIVHSYGGKVYSDVVIEKHAKKAAMAGVDGLILVCAGAGGHGGQLNPFAFVAAVKSFFKGDIILAGAISTGADIAAARAIGADYAYMGTRFIVAEEGNAPDTYKEMIINSSSEDIVYTDAISGVNANFLIPSLTASGINVSELTSGKGKMDFDDHKAWRDIFSAGQGVAAISECQSIAQIVSQLKAEYEEACNRLNVLI
ncbi:nitronate monooxygenase [Lysinibacillus sp. KU-BSD001]|uniref:NAD(P)H-dependent flavin oxidoreductase n=1 Tax=Lysinibacillus sp. KU-BSD001 TaxID=3141328 RepID=UPI0036EB2171